MRYGNSVGTELLAEFLKKFVAQFARCHLNADALLLGVGLRVEMLHVEFHSSFLTKLSHECFIGIRFLATQMKIAMRRHEGLFQVEQAQQQGHRVGTAGECDDG